MGRILFKSGPSLPVFLNSGGSRNSNLHTRIEYINLFLKSSGGSLTSPYIITGTPLDSGGSGRLPLVTNPTPPTQPEVPTQLVDTRYSVS